MQSFSVLKAPGSSAQRYATKLKGISVARLAVEYLVGLVEVGGPSPKEYGLVTQSFSKIMGAAQDGELTADDIRKTWLQLGPAFGPDTMQGHGIRKPFGYAGDFEMIDRIYQYSLSENKNVRRWDEYFQSREACVAVRNRKDFFISLMTEINSAERKTRVLNVGSGPARDIHEFYSQCGTSDSVLVDCVDMDENAISYAKGLCSELLEYITFHQANIFKWRSGETYDFIWSAGLFDYLNDSAFVVLFRRLALMLNPGGHLVVGNFSTNNPTRDYMEFGEWFLHHRSKEGLIQLAEKCEIPNIILSIEEEPQGINLFLHLQKTK